MFSIKKSGSETKNSSVVSGYTVRMKKYDTCAFWEIFSFLFWFYIIARLK